MTMHKRLYITDPLNGILKQNLTKTCISKSFSVKFLKDVWYIFISNNITIHLNNCHLVGALRDKNRSRANCVPIYGDLYQNLQ